MCPKACAMPPKTSSLLVLHEARDQIALQEPSIKRLPPHDDLVHFPLDYRLTELFQGSS